MEFIDLDEISFEGIFIFLFNVFLGIVKCKNILFGIYSKQ